MSVMSMTGFARYDGESAGSAFGWELRSVNGKGLEVRVRTPPGLDRLEAEIRRAVQVRLSRGHLNLTLTIDRGRGAASGVTVDAGLLAELVRISAGLVRDGHAALPTADGLLSLRGVLDMAPAADSEAVPDDLARDLLAGLDVALERLVASRSEEGRALRALLDDQLDRIAALAAEAENDPARSIDVIRARLQRQVAELLGAAGSAFDEARLHAEAALLAAKADIREELDRLSAHVAACRELLEQGGPIGRRLDFMAQEFNRESNTLCSKSNATSLTAIGVELKVVVDQFREQVQNIE
ncbi:YicC/YloC family endoribonuclease [Aureimonas pseudogalii]|uniref:Uncharacterized protein (TIGR00255 family) n=1 Tax=Aureimonas pseudogalii TaxID=1744844 RepID=A0A7W6EHG6_9HYPH|nr:YicC/YloC family endoribonuclease [Aureimonas pseudogalii]MBB3998563.1 uncharacterized protein (TIGR00255 family) [Aureimonas pseudogalii]